MSRLTSSEGWQTSLGSALLLIVVTAVAARAAWTLLAPIVPVLVAGLIVFGLTRLLFRGRG